jgi:ABC-type sulfate/molybdate transport systems ATPase subunit
MITHDIEFVADCSPYIVLMSQGKIVVKGVAEEILTNINLTVQASILPPQITQIFLGLSDLGLPKKVINVHDGKRILLDFLETSL